MVYIYIIRIPITDPAASRPDSGIVDVEPETNILEKPELTLLKPDPPTRFVINKIF